MVMAEMQPESVKRVIGTLGEHLSGPSVEDQDHFGFIVEYEAAYRIGPRP
jgi:hypothetical protein